MGQPAAVFLAAILISFGISSLLPPYSTQASWVERSAQTQKSLAERKTGSASTGEPAETRLVTTTAELNRITTDWMDTDVPAAAVPLIKRLKHDLRDVIIATINRPEVIDTDPSAMQSAVRGRLAQLGVQISDYDDDQRVASEEANGRTFRYGDIYTIDITKPETKQDLLVVGATIGVCCGDDTSLYLLSRNGDKWRLSIEEESGPYEQVSGARGALKYWVGQADETGQPFLVFAYIEPWCSSNWNQVNYQVVESGVSPEGPRVLFRDQPSAFIETDPIFSLVGEAGGFKLTWTAEFGLDSGRFTRQYVARYKVGAREITRIQPVALLPEDFVDEWVRMPWITASRWSSAATHRALNAWHERLQQTHSGRRSTCGSEIIASTESQENPGAWDVEVAFWDDEQDEAAGEEAGRGTGEEAPGHDNNLCGSHLMFTVQKTGDEFIMKKITRLEAHPAP